MKVVSLTVMLKKRTHIAQEENEWLRSHDSRDILLQQAGALADDDNLAELRANIYAARGRPETEEETQV